jgi:hypothetical protein
METMMTTTSRLSILKNINKSLSNPGNGMNGRNDLIRKVELNALLNLGVLSIH